MASCALVAQCGPLRAAQCGYANERLFGKLKASKSYDRPPTCQLCCVVVVGPFGRPQAANARAHTRNRQELLGRQIGARARSPELANDNELNESKLIDSRQACWLELLSNVRILASQWLGIVVCSFVRLSARLAAAGKLDELDALTNQKRTRPSS